MKRIVALAGDGIGPEIMAQGLRVLEHASRGRFDYTVEAYDFGGVAIDRHGHPFPESTRKACEQADAILLGAIGGPQWEQVAVTPEQGLLQLRQTLGLYANLRPTKIMAGLEELSPLKEEVIRGTDFIIVRELVGDVYFGRPKYHDHEEAFDMMYYSRSQIEAIARVAFDLAMTRDRRVTSIDKANVLANSKLWRQIMNEVAADYPQVTLSHLYVDNAAMQLITNPNQFDVIVTANLFGDILSDEASVIPGSLGMAGSASLSDQYASLYEPIHGSAPDIAGMDIANPISMIASITMMLRQSFAEYELADSIDQAVNRAIAQGYRTRDLGGTTSTEEFAQAVIDVL